MDSVEILKGRALDDDEYFKAALLGWCVEFVSYSFLDTTLIFLALSLSCWEISSHSVLVAPERGGGLRLPSNHDSSHIR